MKFTFIVTFIVLLVLGACSSTKENSFGDKLIGQGAEVREIGEKWSDGEELIAEGAELIEDGEDDVADGESLISKGKSKVSKGESFIKKGNKMKVEAEEEYRLRDGSNKSQ
tara:strand:+ start:616 stop:948 length:333 start_codon:yes stop_codon:yes gene_type:complete